MVRDKGNAYGGMLRGHCPATYPVLVRNGHEGVHGKPSSSLLCAQAIVPRPAHDFSGVDKVVVVKAAGLALFGLVTQRLVMPGCRVRVGCVRAEGI